MRIQVSSLKGPEVDLNIRIAGQAGQGVQSAGVLLTGALVKTGLHVLGTKSYMSRVRGGLNWFDIRIADHELFAGTDRADVLVALTDEARDILADEVSSDGVVLYNGEGDGQAVCIEFEKVAAEVGGAKIMANSVAAGAVYALLGYDVEQLAAHLAEEFGGKGQDVASSNAACARKGAELAAQAGRSLKAPAPAGAPARLVTGASAIGEAACKAGLKLAAAYPMTPSTATFTYFAANADRFGLVVEQAEDEIAAVNMICGAAYAGAIAMATTSGGGFALMVEGLSLAGMMELPIVILIAQRPGPATGQPTRTAQQDLLFALHAGHGEFPRAIYAPGTVEQCATRTAAAIAAACKHQSPTIILTDQFLQDLEKNADLPDIKPVDRCIVTDAGENYRRYAVTDSGVSPRAIPGRAARVVCDSDEHVEAGNITEDIRTRIAQQDKRMRKSAGLAADAIPPDLYGDADAETLLIAWGSTYGPAREAVDRLNSGGESCAMLHFSQVWPIAASAAEAIGRRRRVVCVEGNQTGQFASLLRQRGIVGDVELLRRYDGLPFTADYIVNKLEEQAQ
jgi:2-oxoglutarate ferredoxin oxidoreductase subunit alpha